MITCSCVISHLFCRLLKNFLPAAFEKKYQDMGFDAKRSKPLYFNGVRGFIFGDSFLMIDETYYI